MTRHPAPILMALAALLLSAPLSLSAQALDETMTAPAPRVEVAFVLDTTGSMGGLIEGAKARIWDIANLIISAEPTPDVRFGLIGYRDRGDEYVTRFYDLTDDIDAIYGQLMSFVAAGGGDTPESVNLALAEAVERMSWTAEDPNGQKVLRLVFLVGDAPPQMYADEMTYQQAAARAVERGIIINTIQCGNIGGTEPVWREIASLARGEYAAIAQDGDVRIVATPFDEELARLNGELGRTIVAYGRAEERRELEGYQTLSETAAAPAAADRLAFNRSRGLVGGRGGDLVDAVNNGMVELGGLEDDALPEPMQTMSAEEREAYIAAQTERRAEIQAQIDALLSQRQAHLDAERARMRDEGRLTGFDAEVERTIRAQAAAADIHFAD
jgi:hypothetical protein